MKKRASTQRVSYVFGSVSNKVLYIEENYCYAACKAVENLKKNYGNFQGTYIDSSTSNCLLIDSLSSSFLEFNLSWNLHRPSFYKVYKMPFLPSFLCFFTGWFCRWWCRWNFWIFVLNAYLKNIHFTSFFFKLFVKKILFGFRERKKILELCLFTFLLFLLLLLLFWKTECQMFDLENVVCGNFHGHIHVQNVKIRESKWNPIDLLSVRFGTTPLFYFW